MFSFYALFNCELYFNLTTKLTHIVDPRSLTYVCIKNQIQNKTKIHQSHTLQEQHDNFIHFYVYNYRYLKSPQMTRKSRNRRFHAFHQITLIRIVSRMYLSP